VLTRDGCTSIVAPGLTVRNVTEEAATQLRSSDLNPQQQTCGLPPEQLNTSMPNVLLIGDSISMGTGTAKEVPWAPHNNTPAVPLGYGWDVQAALEPVGLAKVQHSGGYYGGGQAGPSSNGVNCIDHWLGEGTWDIVHMNFGLHDVDSSEFVPPADYVRNLDLIYFKIAAKLKPKTGRFIWAQTTPVPFPSDYRLRNNSAVKNYNHLAAKLWASKPEGSVIINDLYGLVTTVCGSSGPLGSYSSCSFQRQWTGGNDDHPGNGTTGGVHYNARGRRYLGLAVASIVAQHLPITHNGSQHQPQHPRLKADDPDGRCALDASPQLKMDDRLAAIAAVESAPVVFWHSEGQGPNTTVMAMGGGLAGVGVQLRDAVSGQALPAPQVLDSWDASVKFALPPAPTWRTPATSSIAYQFRACAGPQACSGWRSINSPDITWASGDMSANASTVATVGGWLKVYGRSLGFTTNGDCAPATVQAPGPASGTAATLISGSTSIKLTPSAASCYDASFALPLTIEPGQYNFSIVNRLSAQAGSVSVTIIAPQPWLSKVRCCNNPYTIY
jgi:hypothetical protein